LGISVLEKKEGDKNMKKFLLPFVAVEIYVF